MFAGIYFHDRRVRYTGWLTASYLSGVIAALLDIAQPHSPLARWTKPITSPNCFKRDQRQCRRDGAYGTDGDGGDRHGALLPG